jgi:hypothetical protein
MKYAKVEGYPNLLRNLDTNAIINTDEMASNNYDLIKKRREEENLKISNIEEDLRVLKSSLDEIKTLLKNIKNTF